MKRLLPLTLLALLLAGAAWCASRAPRIYVNGLPLRDSATGGSSAVIVKDGVTYVPLRAVHAHFAYDNKTIGGVPFIVEG